MTAPRVSVVMSVYNGAKRLEATLRSILEQEDCDLEFIVVNDGSKDETARILDDVAAADKRLKVIHQLNTGLTRALVRGCGEARGEFIARQDAGDISLPGRIRAQMEYLVTNPETVMVSTGARFVGPCEEPLYETVRAGHALERGLANLDVREIEGPPHHGAVMFRRAAYSRAGGYRPAFPVAQDVDLWLRLVEQGNCWGLDKVYYVARLDAHSISGTRRKEQFRAGSLAIECARARRNGQGDAALIDSQVLATNAIHGPPTRRERSHFYYFIGACLGHRDPATAKRYFRRAAREDPLFFKAIARSIVG